MKPFTYLHDHLINTHNVLQCSDTLLKSFANSGEIRHDFQVFILTKRSLEIQISGVDQTWRMRRVFVSSTKTCSKFCRLSEKHLFLINQAEGTFHHWRISCKLINGCFNQVARSRAPWAVLHLFKTLNNVKLLGPCPDSTLQVQPTDTF